MKKENRRQAITRLAQQEAREKGMTLKQVLIAWSNSPDPEIQNRFVYLLADPGTLDFPDVELDFA